MLKGQKKCFNVDFTLVGLDDNGDKDLFALLYVQSDDGFDDVTSPGVDQFLPVPRPNDLRTRVAYEVYLQLGRLTLSYLGLAVVFKNGFGRTETSKVIKYMSMRCLVVLAGHSITITITTTSMSMRCLVISGGHSTASRPFST